MRLHFHTLDVFTQKRFGGNPLAVVHAADQLTSAQMQAIAREFNLSESVFVLKAHKPTHTACVRIFTPAAEVPFAGHPTVGTAALLAELRVASLGGNHDALIALEEGVGTVRVGVRIREGHTTFAEFDAPKLPAESGSVPATDDLAAAIGLIPKEIGFENHRPTRFSAGLPFTFIPVRSLEAIARARPMHSHWERTFQNEAQSAAYVYCRETMQKSAQFHARMFAPGHGVEEDPATGSAAAAFAAVIQRFDTPPAGEHRYLIEQGMEMGRESLINLGIVVEGGKLETIRIGGHTVLVSEGHMEV